MAEGEAPPLLFTWEGDLFRPAGAHWQKQCDQFYVIGEKYRLVEYHDRSITSHNHEFAWLADAWANLPDDLHERFPSAEHLRKYALIRTGWCESTDTVFSTSDDALAGGTLARRGDTYAVIEVKGTVVRRHSAKSQSKRAMGKQDFQRSKDDILAYIAGMLNVTPEQLMANSGKSGEGRR